MPQIQVRRGTTAQWTAANPILAAGEPGYDTTLEVFKIGNGTDHWLTLPAGEGMSEADADARYAPVNPDVTINRNGSGVVTSVVENGVSTVLGRNSDGSLATVKRGDEPTKTVIRNGAGQITGVSA